MGVYQRDLLELQVNKMMARAALTALFWFALGGGGGWLGAVLAEVHFAVGAFAGAFVGAVIGESRAQTLRIQAQALALQLEIERHLAELVEIAKRPAPPPFRIT